MAGGVARVLPTQPLLIRRYTWMFLSILYSHSKSLEYKRGNLKTKWFPWSRWRSKKYVLPTDVCLDNFSLAFLLNSLYHEFRRPKSKFSSTSTITLKYCLLLELLRLYHTKILTVLLVICSDVTGAIFHWWISCQKGMRSLFFKKME